MDGPPPSYAELSHKARRVLGAVLDRLLVTAPKLHARDLNRTVEVTAKFVAMFREEPAADARPDVPGDFDAEQAAERIVDSLEATARDMGLALVRGEALEGGEQP